MSRPIILKKQVKKIVLDEIKTFGLRPGDRIKTELEYAAQLKVSRMTVNKAIKELEKEGIIERRKGAGSFVSHLAPTTLTPTTELSFIWDGYTGKEQNISFQGRSLQALETLGDEFGMKIRNIPYTFQPPDSDTNFFNIVSNLANRGTQAALIQSPAFYHKNDIPDATKEAYRETYFENMYRLREANIPFLVMDHMGHLELNSHTPWDVVMFDLQQMGAQIIHHLWAHGHRRIGVLGYHWGYPWQSERLLGCRRTLKILGGELPTSHVFTYNDPDRTPYRLKDSKKCEFLKWLKKNKLTALVCINDPLAFAIMDVLREEQIQVPKDISITGFDNLNIQSNSELTTIDFSVEESIRIALSILRQKLDAPKRTRINRHIMIEPRLIERFSVTFHSP